MGGNAGSHRTTTLDEAIRLSAAVGRVYLGPGDRPPRGAAVRTGPRGGRFYEGSPERAAHTPHGAVAQALGMVRLSGRTVADLASGHAARRGDVRRCRDCGRPRSRLGVCSFPRCPARAEWDFVADLLRMPPPPGPGSPGFGRS